MINVEFYLFSDRILCLTNYDYVLFWYIASYDNDNSLPSSHQMLSSTNSKSSAVRSPETMANKGNQPQNIRLKPKRINLQRPSPKPNGAKISKLKFKRSPSKSKRAKKLKLDQTKSKSKSSPSRKRRSKREADDDSTEDETETEDKSESDIDHQENHDEYDNDSTEDEAETEDESEFDTDHQENHDEYDRRRRRRNRERSNWTDKHEWIIDVDQYNEGDYQTKMVTHWIRYDFEPRNGDREFKLSYKDANKGSKARGNVKGSVFERMTDKKKKIAYKSMISPTSALGVYLELDKPWEERKDSHKDTTDLIVHLYREGKIDKPTVDNTKLVHSMVDMYIPIPKKKKDGDDEKDEDDGDDEEEEESETQIHPEEQWRLDFINFIKSRNGALVDANGNPCVLKVHFEIESSNGCTFFTDLVYCSAFNGTKTAVFDIELDNEWNKCPLGNPFGSNADTKTETHARAWFNQIYNQRLAIQDGMTSKEQPIKKKSWRNPYDIHKLLRRASNKEKAKKNLKKQVMSYVKFYQIDQYGKRREVEHWDDAVSDVSSCTLGDDSSLMNSSDESDEGGHASGGGADDGLELVGNNNNHNRNNNAHQVSDESDGGDHTSGRDAVDGLELVDIDNNNNRNNNDHQGSDQEDDMNQEDTSLMVTDEQNNNENGEDEEIEQVLPITGPNRFSNELAGSKRKKQDDTDKFRAKSVKRRHIIHQDRQSGREVAKIYYDKK